MTGSAFSWKAFLGTVLLLIAATAALLAMMIAEWRTAFDTATTTQIRFEAALLAGQMASLPPERRASEVARFLSLAPGGTEAAAFAFERSTKQLVALTANGDELLADAAVRVMLESAASTGSAHDRVMPRDRTARLVTAAVAINPAAGGGVVAWVARPAWVPGGAGAAAVRLAAAGGALVIVVTVALTGMHVRLRRRVLHGVVDTVRSLSRGDFSVPPQMGRDSPLDVLSDSLRDMRRRLMVQLATIDRQRQTLESLVNQLREGVIVVRNDGCIELVNPAAARLLRLSAGPAASDTPLVGQSIERGIPHHDLQAMARGEAPARPENANDLLAPPRASWEAQASPGERVTIDTQDGTIHLLVHATDIALPNEHGDASPPGRLLVLLDISELERLVQMKTDFVANASHELRTPLSTIRAAIETLQGIEPQEDADGVRHFLKVIDRNSARLEALVSDLLDLARVESPAARFEPRPIDLGELVDDLHNRFSDALSRKGLRWEADLAGCRQLVIQASPHLLNLAVDNLVDNAVKFTDRGGTIRVSCRDHDSESVQIEVADEGCGIPESDLERVFERFYQVERARSGAERGTGLGLSIVRHAVSALRGRVAVGSEVGVGTRFTITLPIDPSQFRERVRAAVQGNRV